MSEATLVPELQSLLVEQLSQVVDASSTDLNVLMASESWEAMFHDQPEKASLRGQLGSEVFDDFKRWLKVLLASPESRFPFSGSALRSARYRKLSGRDSDGLWFRAMLVVTVPRTSSGAPIGAVPVVLTLENKKMRRRPPRGVLQVSGCTTIFEDLDPDEESAQSSSHSSESHDGLYKSSEPRRSGAHENWQLSNWRVIKSGQQEALSGSSDSSQSGDVPLEHTPGLPASSGSGGSAVFGSFKESPSAPKPSKPRQRILVSL